MDYVNKSREDLILHLLGLEQELDSLKTLILQTTDERNQIEYRLNERIKEFNCLNLISELFNKPNLPVEVFCKELVEIIPTAAVSPEQIKVSITIEDHVFPSNNFRKTTNGGSQEIKVGNKILGQIEIYGMNENLPVNGLMSDGSNFLFTIAAKIGRYIELNRSNKEIAENEERLRVITESSLDAIILIDSQGNISFWNPAAEQILGYKSEEVLGHNLHQLLSPPRYREAHQNAFPNFTVSGEGPVINKVIELEALHKNGKEICIELSISRIQVNNSWHALGFIRDITQKKQDEKSLRESELKYRTLVENINDVVYEIDVNGEIKYISPSIEHIIGLHPKEIIGKNFIDFVGENADYLTHRLNILKQVPEINNEYKIQSKSGQTHWVRLSTRAIFKDGTMTGAFGTLIDITEKKLLDIELQKSEALYRSILQASPDTIFIADLDGNVLFTSPMGRKMFGFDHVEFPVQTSLYHFISPSDHDKARDAIQQMFDGTFSGSTEYVGIKSDGSQFDMEVNGEFIRDTEGNPVSMVFIARDVSDRKTAEKQLRLSESRYKSVLDASPDTITITDLTGKILFSSPKGLSMFGYRDPDDLVNRPLIDFIDENSRIKARTAIGLMLQGVLGGAEEYVGLKADGTRFYIEVNGDFIRDESGQPINMVFVTRDISDRKTAEEKLRKSEESFREIIENLNDVVYEVTNQGIIKYVSPSIERFLGFKPEELIGQNFFDHMHEDDSPVIQQRLATLTSRNYSFLEYRYYSKDQRICWVRSSTNPIIENGRMVGGRGILIDITERKKAEEKLQQSEARYKTFFEGNNSIMLLVDPESGAIKDANPAACRFYGWSREELCSMNISEINLLTLPEIQNEMKMAEATKRMHFIFKHRLSNGEIRDVEVYSGPVQFGKSKLLYSIIHDITERIKVEEKLKESENRFRMVFENVFDGISIFEENEDQAKRKLVDCNEQYAAMAGRSRSELLEIGYTYPLSQIIEENTSQLRKQGLTEQPAYHGSFKWIRPDGKDNTIEYIAQPITWQGKLYSIGIDRDITETRKKEDQLRQLSQAVEQSPVSIVITNLDGNIEYANPQACKTTGYTLEELRGNNPRVLKSGETSPDEYQYLWNTISHGNYWKGLFHNKRKNGELYWESSQIAPILDEKGQITSYLAIKEDITEQKRIQEELYERETDLNYAQEIAKMGSWNLDLKTNHLSWSKNYYRILGLEPYQSDISTDYFINMMHPDDHHLFDNKLQEMHQTRQPVSFDIRIIMPDKQIKWMQNNVVPVFEGDDLVMLKGANIDITEAKQAEEKIRQQNERLSAIIGAMPDLIFIADKHGTYLEYYSSVPNLLVVPDNEIIGKNIREIFEPDLAKLHIQKIDECLQKEQLITYEFSGIDRNIFKSFEIRLVPMNENRVLTFVRDITDKVEKDTEVKKLSLAIEQSPVSIVITDLKANIQYVNPAFEKTSGYSSSEIIGKNTNLLKSGQTPDHMYKNMWETIEMGHEWHGEWINKKKNGELFWENISITPIHDSSGKIINYLAIKQDISERKNTEEILRQNEEKYRYMFVNNPQPMWIYDLETLAFLEVNSAAIDHYGYSREEFLSMSLKNIRPKEDIELLIQDIKATKDEYNPGSEWRHLKKNGELISVEIISHPIFYNNREARHVLVNDITKRKEAELKIRELNTTLEHKIEERTQALAQSERSYRMVVENVAEVIFQTDADGHWIFLNKSWEEITGFSIKESLGQLFANYVYPEDRQRNWELFEPLIKREKDFCHHEIRYLTKDGSYRWIEVFARLGLDNNDQVMGTYGTLQDITDRKKAEEALQQLSARLELALRVGGIGVWDYNVDQNILIWDDQMFKMYGIEKNEAFGNVYDNWLNGLHPEDRERGNAEIIQAINGEKEFDTEFRITWPDGSVHHIKALAALQYNESSHSRHLVGINWDITFQKSLAEFENELLQLSPKLTGIPLSEIEKAINLAISRIGKVLNADRSYIFEFSQDKNHMSNTYEWCNDGIDKQINDLQGLPCNIFPEWMNQLKRLENIIIDSVSDLPETWIAEREILEPQGIKSLIVIPMLVENNLIGFVGLDSVRNKKIYSPTEINILKVWSSMLSSLINNQRAEKLLEQTRQNYETFFNTIDDFLWVLDQQGNIIHTNDTVKNRLEYRAEELLDKSVLMVHPKDRREEAGRIVGEMLAGISEFCPVPVMTKSGKQIPVETKVKPGFWDGKEVIFGVSKDISKIKLSEEKFSAAFQSSSAMMAISSFEDGKFIDVNQAFIKATGYQKQELIGRTIAGFGILPDTNLRDSFISKIRNGETIKEVETIFVTKTKEQRIGLLSSDSIFIGDQRCLLTVTIDITARKRAEEQLQWNKSLLEMMSNSSPLGFLVVDNTTDDILYFNKRFCQIWEIEHLEEQMLHGELKNNDIIPYCLPVLVDVQSFAKSCKPLQDENNRIIVSDEIPFTNDRTIHRYSTQIRGVDDKYYGRFYIFEDVTEEKKAEEELRSARNEAEKANVAKSEFLSRMSHELRTPMNSILGFAQLLEMGELNPGQRKGVTHIMKSGKHLLDLINEVLDISRIESGRLSLSLEPVQLNNLIIEMTDVIKLQAAERQISVKLAESPDNMLFVKSDRQRLKQVLLNLLNNAIKYNRTGGMVVIEVAMRSDKMIRVSVTDTGLGIDKEFIPKLFTPFERIGADKTGTEGTGLGLSVVKKLMEAMGGNYGVESTPGKGSTFWIELPYSESQMENAVKSGNLLTAENQISGKTGKILYIEDNRSNIELVEQILTSQRTDIELITDIHGKKAIQLAKNHSPDLILLDLNLPDIHGSVVLQQILNEEKTRNIPVVVISADAMPQQMNNLVKSGARNYLTKPLDIPVFLKLIEEYLPSQSQ